MRTTHTSIPIPSFDPMHMASVPPQPSPTVTTKWPCYGKRLLKMEATLQLFFKKRKTAPGNGVRNDIISLEDFYTLVKKFVSTPTTSEDNNANNKEANTTRPVPQGATPILLPSIEEQVLHDLVCVTAPILYRMVKAPSLHNNNNNNNNNNNHATLSTLTDAKWSLQSVDFSGNRSVELKRLLLLQVDPQEWSLKSGQIIPLIVSHRNSQQQQQQQQQRSSKTNGANSSSNSSTALKRGSLIDEKQQQQQGITTTTTAANKSNAIWSEPYIHTGMTLEERVRARAAANTNRQEDQRALTSDAAANELVNSATLSSPSSSASLLLPYADVLWSHARNIMSQYQSNIRYRPAAITSSSPPSARAVPNCRCIMTLKDVVEVLMTRAIVTQQDIVSRRQMVEVVQQLSHLAPDWITVTDPEENETPKRRMSSNQQPERRLSKHTTVWIQPVEYATIRARLGSTASTDTTTMTTPVAAIAHVESPAASSSSSSSSSSSVDRSFTHDSDMDEEPGPRQAAAAAPAAKRARRQLEPTIIKPPTKETFEAEEQSIPSPTSIGSKRLLLDRNGQSHDAPYHQPTPILPKKNKMGMLRINRNLIFTDADYDGGEIIEPTQFDSPRGLKRLLGQLNAGHRI